MFVVTFVVAQSKNQALEKANQDDLGIVEDEFQDLFFEALTQKAIENHEKAIIALRRALVISGDQAVLYYELGKNYRELERYSAAIENFLKALDLDPGREDILVGLYDTYVEIQDFERAIVIVEELIGMNDVYMEDLANLYLLNEQYPEALSLIDTLDEQLGSNTYRNSLRRQIYARTNNIDAQIQNLRESIATNPERERNYLNLIYMYSEQGMDKEAFEVAGDLLQNNPGSTLAHLALYKFHLDKQQPEAAISSMEVVFASEEIDIESKYKVLNDFLTYVQIHPAYETRLVQVARQLSSNEKVPGLFERLGAYYSKKNDLGNALKFYEIGLKKDPNNLDLIKKILSLQLELEQYGEMVQLSTRGLDNFTGTTEFYLYLGIALNKQERFLEAEKSLQEGLSFLEDDLSLIAQFHAELSIS